MAYNLQTYDEVKDRIPKFLANYPDARVITKMVGDISEIKEIAIVKAYLYNGDILLSTGHAFELAGVGGMANKHAHLENCETSAIGRALANIGYCGDKRASREEMKKVQRMEEQAAENEQLYTARIDELAGICEKYHISDKEKKEMFSRFKGRGAKEKILSENWGAIRDMFISCGEEQQPNFGGDDND